MGSAAGDAVVYPAWRDVEGEFVVEDCLEGRDDLYSVIKSKNNEMTN